MLVTTLPNTPPFMRDRHEQFEDPMTWTQDIRKTKFNLVRFFFTHPLVLALTMPLGMELFLTMLLPMTIFFVSS